MMMHSPDFYICVSLVLCLGLAKFNSCILHPPSYRGSSDTPSHLSLVFLSSRRHLRQRVEAASCHASSKTWYLIAHTNLWSSKLRLTLISPKCLYILLFPVWVSSTSPARDANGKYGDGLLCHHTSGLCPFSVETFSVVPEALWLGTQA